MVGDSVAGSAAVVGTGLAGAAFSLSLETVQHFLTWRYSSILDAAGNALGATIEAAVNEYWS